MKMCQHLNIDVVTNCSFIRPKDQRELFPYPTSTIWVSGFLLDALNDAKVNDYGGNGFTANFISTLLLTDV